jgi:hypothetical protein
MITDNTVSKVIAAKKYLRRVIDLDKLALSPDGNFRLGKANLVCEEYECRIMIRQNVDRPANFSIILIYRDPIDGDVAVLRFNGDHGGHTNRLEKERIRGPHIHIMTERYQEMTTHPDGYAMPARGYKDIKGAMIQFMGMANISYRTENGQKRLEEYRWMKS